MLLLIVIVIAMLNLTLGFVTRYNGNNVITLLSKKLKKNTIIRMVSTDKAKEKKKSKKEDENDLPFKMEDLVNLCKRKGFVFQSSEIYSPMAGFFDYGPLGCELKNNIKEY
jgi:hypothetical protein